MPLIRGIFISPGNTKLGDIPSISLPPGKSCAVKECFKDCYAHKIGRLRPQVQLRWDDNYAIWQQLPDLYWTTIDRFLTAERPERFRFHVSGDIPTQEYLECMKATAARHVDVKILCFTKRADLSYYGLPANLRIVLSAWPGVPLPGFDTSASQLPVAWMRDPKQPDLRIPLTATKCSGGCEKCSLCWGLGPGESVVFDKH